MENVFDTMKATFTSGATSSEAKPRYDLIPPTALKRLAERFGYGARKHGDHNYKQGYRDHEFVRDRINHLIEHAVQYASGDRTEDHLGAVMCNAAMLAELERMAVDCRESYDDRQLRSGEAQRSITEELRAAGY
jgi:hypothetical protein